MEKNQNSNKFEWVVELGRTLSEKVSNTNAGKIVLFAAYAGAMLGGLKVVLEQMDKPKAVEIQ